jgi:choline monooxygenase
MNDQGRGFDPQEFFVDSDISKAETLPATAFTHPDFLQLELETIFARNWLFLPQRSSEELRNDPRSLAEMVETRGSQLPFTTLGRPLFLQRDWSGRLHCFPNVCTHAWHTLVEGPGRERMITCPQHGRQFDADGKFVSQPGFKGMPGFPRDCDHLVDLGVEEWAQFLFVCLGKPAVGAAELLAPLRESLGGLGIASMRREPRESEAREVEGNWKQHAWNYMDKFHVGFIHRAPGGLADAIDLPSYRTELHGLSSLQWAYARDPEAGFAPGQLPERFHDPKDRDRRVFALWWFLFPNLTLNFYPWGLSLNVYQPVPEDPQRTLFLWYHYVLDEKKYAMKDKLWLDTQVDAEDVAALRQVARGARSGLAPRGRFAPGEEAGPHWFHRLVYQFAFGER